MGMQQLKSGLVQKAGPLGGYRICRWLTRSTPKVLMYHRFSEQPAAGCVHRAEFERQVGYLARHFSVLRMDQVFEVLASGQNLPADAVVITVDDGYLDFYEIAFPVLRAVGLPATLFLTTRFVDGDFWLWPDQVRYILQHSEVLESMAIPGYASMAGIPLDAGSRDMFWMRIVEYLLSVDETVKQDWLREFTARQGVEFPVSPVGEYSAVNWEQVREMSASNIEMGAHTRSHPSLGKLARARLAEEVQGSADDVERQTGRRPVSFCYPNGQPGDYNNIVKDFVRHAGYKGAVTAFYDRNVVADLFEVRRFTASEKRFQFEKSVNGVELLAARWLNSSNRHAKGIY